MSNNRWSAEEDAILTEQLPNTITKAIAARLGRTMASVRYRAHKLGIKKSREWFASDDSTRLRPGRRNSVGQPFKRGHTPWNKGTKGKKSPNAHSFQPGNRPHTWRPIGTVTLRGGYWHRKIANTGDRKQDWRAVHTLLWEQHHGPVPDGHVIVFADGDNLNTTIGNLRLLSRRELAWLNQHYPDIPTALRETTLALSRVEVKCRTLTEHREEEPA